MVVSHFCPNCQKCTRGSDYHATVCENCAKRIPYTGRFSHQENRLLHNTKTGRKVLKALEEIKKSHIRARNSTSSYYNSAVARYEDALNFHRLTVYTKPVTRFTEKEEVPQNPIESVYCYKCGNYYPVKKGEYSECNCSGDEVNKIPEGDTKKDLDVLAQVYFTSMMSHETSLKRVKKQVFKGYDEHELDVIQRLSEEYRKNKAEIEASTTIVKGSCSTGPR